MHEKAMLRLGSASAIAGAVLAAIVSVLHPWMPDLTDPAVMLRDIASSRLWIGVHVGIAFAALLYGLGLTGIYRSITRAPASAWARLGFVTAVLGLAPMYSLLGIEIALKGFAAAWTSAAEPDKGIQLQIAAALLSVGLALFAMAVTVFFGAAHLLFGIAMLPGDVYPRWLGSLAIVGGLGCTWIGVIQLYRGPSHLMTNIMFFIFSALLTLWLLVAGVLMRRMAAVRR